MEKKRVDKFYQSDLDIFPDLETYLAELKELDKYDFGNHTALEIYHKFYDYARITPTNYGTLNPVKFNSHSFYRVRLNINKTLEDVTLAQTYSYPPTNFCTQNGRANLKYRTVFYCSNNPYAAIIESKPEVGDYGYLSVWNGQAKRTIKAGICLPYDLPTDNDWYLMAKDILDLHKSTLEANAKDKVEHYKALFKFISNRFVNEIKPYPITSMLSYEMLMGQELWRDFIIYPSVISKSKYCNMAFHPNSVNENLALERVYRFEVVEFQNGLPKVKFENKSRRIMLTRMIEEKLTDKQHDFLTKTCR